MEVANFDTQAIRAGRSKLPGWAYQRGPQYGFENVKMYVRARDDYTCRHCGVESPPDLRVHHLRPRAEGGTDQPGNLITLCQSCHEGVHRGDVTLDVRPGRSYRAVAHTQAGKTATLEALTAIAPVETTYGRMGFVEGRRSSGYFAISDLDGHLIAPAISYEKLRLIERSSTLLTERREAASSPDWKPALSPVLSAVEGEAEGLGVPPPESYDQIKN